jgi:hypothetical protein
MGKYTDEQVIQLIEALNAWMKYADTNYSGDGMDAIKLTRLALSNIK